MPRGKGGSGTALTDGPGGSSSSSSTDALPPRVEALLQHLDRSGVSAAVLLGACEDLTTQVRGCAVTM